MTHDPGLWSVAYLAAATGYGLLGLWVLRLEPRTRRALYLGIFSVALALYGLASSISYLLDARNAGITLLLIGASLVSSGSLLALCVELSRPALAPGRGPPLWAGAAGAVTGAVVAYGDLIFLRGVDLTYLEAAAPMDPAWLLAGSYGVGTALWTAGLVLLWLGAKGGGLHDRRVSAQLGLVTAALFLYYSFGLGTSVTFLAEASVEGSLDQQVLVLAFTVLFLAMAGLWLWSAHRAEQPTAQVHVRVAWAILATLLVGALVQASIEGDTYDAMFSTGQVMGLLLLTYAVLRHDLAGLDAKVRWGISKGTVAGAFVAVFFVVSEGAQELFAGFAGSQWIGIGAAGVLLFALAPLQRLADQLAARAIPVADAPVISASEERYATAVRMALADGEISRAEERELARLAEETGISPVRALELLEEAEASGRGPA